MLHSLSVGHGSERSVSHIGPGYYQSARHGRLELLLSRRGFHPRQHMLEWRSRDPEITAEWVAEGDNQDQHQDAGGGQQSRPREQLKARILLRADESPLGPNWN